VAQGSSGIKKPRRDYRKRLLNAGERSQRERFYHLGRAPFIALLYWFPRWTTYGLAAGMGLLGFAIYRKRRMARTA
jgi:hypothetical protein